MFFKRSIGAIGRIFISSVFIISALNKIFDWDEVLDSFTSTLNEWIFFGGNLPWMDEGVALMMEYAPILMIVAVAIELVGGLSLLFGIRPRFGAGLLIIFLIPATLLYHHFWFLYGDERDLQLVMFLKNCAIIGGLMQVSSMGRTIKRSEILHAISRSTD
ncbi:MAG: hypothetical protein ChlgKO_13920 [Chlamydiales bacterium]